MSASTSKNAAGPPFLLLPCDGDGSMPRRPAANMSGALARARQQQHPASRLGRPSKGPCLTALTALGGDGLGL